VVWCDRLRRGDSIAVQALNMLRWTIVVPLWTVGALLVLQAPMQAQAGDSHLPVSLERIRAALKEQPPVLQVPPWSGEAPTFRVEVRQPFSALRSIEDEPFDPTFGLPSGGELLMSGIEKIRTAAVGYKRRRAERRARREVKEALAAFCAVHECPAPDTRR
jgi:hypothetical protein